MVDFRNSLIPSSSEQVAPFPAGLNDCVSGVKWVASNHAELGINAEQIIIAENPEGESHVSDGIEAQREGNMTLVRGLYALSIHRGNLPLPENPSSVENNGILLDLHNNQGAWRMGSKS